MEQRHPGLTASAGAGMLGPEAIIWKTWAGVTSDVHGFGDAVQGHGRMWVKTTLGRWGREQNFFPAATQHCILPSLVTREAA